MARQTRSERRARRAAQAESKAALERNRSRPQQVRPAVAPAPSSGGAERRGSGGGLFGGTRRFVHESWGELQKVEWPGQSQLIQGTVVVLIACFIVGLYLFLADELFRRLVQQVLLK
ncbi:MAG TPA: preprotein translocase subunit SecE [Gaiellaceae bacterium]|jgi:preprotein translocase SecE subunit|nr:preprotein translocase subunit SecE [Gaiellaceae bacterium]